jgi:hypothetical protein
VIAILGGIAGVDGVMSRQSWMLLAMWLVVFLPGSVIGYLLTWAARVVLGERVDWA